jgi:hypothetical protein
VRPREAVRAIGFDGHAWRAGSRPSGMICLASLSGMAIINSEPVQHFVLFGPFMDGSSDVEGAQRLPRFKFGRKFRMDRVERSAVQ